jgi:hypothetical protein
MSEKYVDKRLLKLTKGNGKYLKLDVGDSFVGTYLTWRAEKDEKYDKIKPVYLFKNENGEEKQLGTGAKKFGAKMASVIPGSKVQITKLGEGQKTDFSVKVLKVASMPKDVDEDEEEDEEEEEEVVVKKVKKAKKVVEEEEEEDEEDDEEEDEEEDEDLFAKK